MSIKNTIRQNSNSIENARDSHAGKGRDAIVRCLLVCVLMVMISSCSITKDYKRPQVDIPNNWRVDYQTAADLANAAWWEQFQDPVLNELIKSALNENKDLRIAAARVEEFTGRLQSVQSGFYPQLYYGVAASRDYQSQERPIPQLARGTERGNSIYQTSLNMNWELDMWGRLRRATEAVRADLLSSEEGRQVVILTLVSAVAEGYIDLLSLDKQLQICKQTLADRAEFLQLFENKFNGGMVSGLELAQVRSTYEQIAEYIPIIERQIALKENALSLLLGRNPETVSRSKTLDMLIMPEVPQGIPSDLLVQRPDIRQSEQDLIAANARIGVARTQYFPSISLTGLFGFASSSLTDLFQESANLWQAAAGAAGTLFSGGRIKGEIRQAEAVQEELLFNYISTIQTAFREVNDSLINIQKLRQLLEIQERQIKTLKEYVYFAHSRYDAKFSSSINNIIDAERSLFIAEINYVQTQNELFAAMVNCYKAMGGGWVTEAAKLIVSPSLNIEPMGTEVADEGQKTGYTEGTRK